MRSQTGIDDPHVAASLFKLWLRDLRDPIIPENMYNEALQASKTDIQSVALVKRLPVLNKRVLLFVISFFQLFIKPEVVEVTKMTPQNLGELRSLRPSAFPDDVIALVLAPNLLRTTSDNLQTVFTNSTFESKFVLQLLEHLKPEDVDAEYKPSHGQAAPRR